jgi:hypothetical protein
MGFLKAGWLGCVSSLTDGVEVNIHTYMHTETYIPVHCSGRGAKVWDLQSRVVRLRVEFDRWSGRKLT